MAQSDELVGVLKDWLTAVSPGLVRREDLARLEERLDELAALVDEIEAEVERLLAAGARPPG